MNSRGEYGRRRFPGLLGLGFLLAVLIPQLLFAAPIATNRSLVVLGDSLSAGYGVDPVESWPSVLQRFLQAEGLPWTVVNAGVSGDTSAGGLRRLDWLLRRPVDALVIELGANDGLRGLPLEATRTNLQSVIERTRARWPSARIVLAGMRLPENLGPDYTGRFVGLFPDLASRNGVGLIPFLLEGVAGLPELNQADQIHPNAGGHRRVATNVWEVMEPLLREKASTPASTNSPATAVLPPEKGQP